MSGTDSDVMVTLQDLRDLHYCAPGIKHFCRTYGIDIRDFCKGGVPASVMRATGYHFAVRAAEYAEAKHGR